MVSLSTCRMYQSMGAICLRGNDCKDASCLLKHTSLRSDLSQVHVFVHKGQV